MPETNYRESKKSTDARVARELRDLFEKTHRQFVNNPITMGRRDVTGQFIRATLVPRLGPKDEFSDFYNRLNKHIPSYQNTYGIDRYPIADLRGALERISTRADGETKLFLERALIDLQQFILQNDDSIPSIKRTVRLGAPTPTTFRGEPIIFASSVPVPSELEKREPKRTGMDVFNQVYRPQVTPESILNARLNGADISLLKPAELLSIVFERSKEISKTDPSRAITILERAIEYGQKSGTYVTVKEMEEFQLTLLNKANIRANQSF